MSLQPSDPGRQSRAVWVAGAVVLLLSGVLLVTWMTSTSDATSVSPVWAPALHEPHEGPDVTAVPHNAAVPRAPADLAIWRREQSSLRGTELDGDWALDARGQLQPSLALRRRFDHLLLLRDGEANSETLTHAIQAEVETAAGAQAAGQVLDIWQRYLGLLATRFTNQVDLNHPETWGPALAERQRARRDQLGLAWAQAFYAEEEAELQTLINTQTGGQVRGSVLLAAATPASGVTLLGPQGLARETLNAEQRQRLEVVDADQARWADRLAQARREIEALRTAPQLSAPQRCDAIEAWLTQHFDAREQLRIRGLLELPTPGLP